MPRRDTAVDVTGRVTALRHVDLDTFFNPKRVAVVGASDSNAGTNTALTVKITAWAVARGASVHYVNPNRPVVAGRPALKSLTEVDEPLDLVAILVGHPLPVLRDAVAARAKFAVVFAAGFAEVGTKGERVQAEMERIIESGGTHVLGPNTNLNAFEAFRDDLPGRAIALITQSGHQGRPVFQGQEIGIKLSHWAPAGNEVDLESADFIDYFSSLATTGAVACYIEGFKNGRTLQLAPQDAAARRRVPIVVVKVGRTDEGTSMAKAHTGHLTGADDVVSAAFRQYGIQRVDGLDQLLDVSAALARTRAPSPAALRRPDPWRRRQGLRVLHLRRNRRAHGGHGRRRGTGAAAAEPGGAEAAARMDPALSAGLQPRGQRRPASARLARAEDHRDHAGRSRSGPVVVPDRRRRAPHGQQAE